MNDKLMTIEEIDTFLQKQGFAGTKESLTGLNLCEIYKKVRPILVFVKALLFFRPAWQVILQGFIDASDKACP